MPSNDGSPGVRPPYGRRLLPQLLDEISKTTPERLYASVAVSVDLSEGFQDVSFRDMAHATNFFAWWLENNVGRSNLFETLTYMGIPDLRTAVVFLAAIKCGYKVKEAQDHECALTMLAKTFVQASLTITTKPDLN